MSFFWKYTLLFFTISGLLLAFFLLSTKKIGPLKDKLLLIILFLFVLTTLLTVYNSARLNDKFYSPLLYLLFAQLMLYVVLIYFFIIHPGIMGKQGNLVSPLNQKHLKYEKTGLSEAFSLELKNKLEQLMVTQKPYLNHELRLDDIAGLLDISRHHASQVINENFGMSFYDYVNQYRIEEAKNKLSSNNGNLCYSISDIAYQCGFNNRVSFYKAFKKITHTTPTEYMVNAA